MNNHNGQLRNSKFNLTLQPSRFNPNSSATCDNLTGDGANLKSGQHLPNTSNIVNNVNYKINMIKKNTKNYSIGNVNMNITPPVTLNKKDLYNVLSLKTKKDLLNLHISANHDNIWTHLSGNNSPRSKKINVSIHETSNIDEDLDFLYEFKRKNVDKSLSIKPQNKNDGISHSQHLKNNTGNQSIINKSSSHYSSPKYKNMINTLKNQFLEITHKNEGTGHTSTGDGKICIDNPFTNPPSSHSNQKKKEGDKSMSYTLSVMPTVERENNLSPIQPDNTLVTKLKGKVQNFYRKSSNISTETNKQSLKETKQTEDKHTMTMITNTNFIPNDIFFEDKRYKNLLTQLNQCIDEIKRLKEENEDMRTTVKIMKEYSQISQVKFSF